MSTSCVAIRDAKSGSSAKILVGFGFNCFQFTAVKNGQPVELLWAEPEFESGTKRASGSGIPIMFPFAGRIPGTIFRWEGREYQLTAGDGIGNAIHGFVMDRPWRVIAQAEDCLTGQFQASVDEPSLLQCWPADFRITCTYQIVGTTLETHVVLENPDQRPLPYGFGTHPYFRLSLGGASSEDCIVQLPISHQWELVNMLPTGARPAVANAAELQRGAPFRGMTYDNIFTGLQFDGEWCAAKIHDPVAGSTLSIEFNRVFREIVVYTPPHRDAICIEPETCVPNAFDLSRKGLDAGPTQLPPGGRVEGRIRMRLE